MKQLSAILAVIVAVLSLSGCYTVRIAPAVYEEAHHHNDPYYWTLSMAPDGRYSLIRMNPILPRKTEGEDSMTLSFKLEKGRWTKVGDKIILEDDTGAVRTFSIRQDLGGHFLAEDGKSFPVLRWSAEESYLR